MNFYDTVPKSAEVIGNHFKQSRFEKRNEWAERIYDDFSLFLSLEEIDRSDRTSEKDIDSLAYSLKRLNKAITSLTEVGWHGGKALQQAATNIRKQTRAFGYDVGNIDAPSVIS